MMDEEIERVRSARNGDAMAFTELVERHQAMVLRAMRRFTHSADDALDLAQDAFVTAYQRLDTLRDPDRFEPWLRTIAYNVARQWLRRQERVQWQPLDEANDELPEKPSRRSLCPADPLAVEVRDALDRLPLDQRAVVTLHYSGGYDYEEIGAMLGIPASTVRGRLHHARRRLRKEIITMLPLDDQVQAMERVPFVADQEGRTLYDRMIAKVAQAGSFSYETDYRWWTKEREIGRTSFRIRLKKPGYALMEAYQGEVLHGVIVGDGTTFWTYWPAGRPSYCFEAIDHERYDRTRMSSYMKAERPASGFSLWHAAREMGSSGVVFQPSEFFGFRTGLWHYLDGVRHVTEEPVAGEPCDVVEASIMDRQRSHYVWIARSDGLPRQFYEVVRVKDPIFCHEVWRNVKLDPKLPDGLFRWSPPEGWEEFRFPKIEEGLLKPGTEVPDFRASTPDGGEVRLSDFRGKAVWLCFWRVGCPDARDEIPGLEILHREFGEKGLVVLGFNASDDPEIAGRFLHEQGVTFTNILETSEAAWKVAAEAYQTLPGYSGVPLNYLINRDGRVVEAWYDFQEEKGRQLLTGIGFTG